MLERYRQDLAIHQFCYKCDRFRDKRAKCCVFILPVAHKDVLIGMPPIEYP
jgi:hypothetical protein